jgi:hypothetical protein
MRPTDPVRDDVRAASSDASALSVQIRDASPQRIPNRLKSTGVRLAGEPQASAEVDDRNSHPVTAPR